MHCGTRKRVYCPSYTIRAYNMVNSLHTIVYSGWPALLAKSFNLSSTRDGPTLIRVMRLFEIAMLCYFLGET